MVGLWEFAERGSHIGGGNGLTGILAVWLCFAERKASGGAGIEKLSSAGRSP